ncbi:MAG: hypothetical protein WCL51_02235 [Bacteroidota bacterium]
MIAALFVLIDQNSIIIKDLGSQQGGTIDCSYENYFLWISFIQYSQIITIANVSNSQ